VPSFFLECWKWYKVAICYLHFCVFPLILIFNLFASFLFQAVYLAEYESLNKTGELTAAAHYSAELLSCAKRSLARILVLIASMGFGIVKYNFTALKICSDVSPNDCLILKTSLRCDVAKNRWCGRCLHDTVSSRNLLDFGPAKERRIS